jgi:phenylacetate-CoA ligase
MRARLWWGVRPGDTEILLWGAPNELKTQDRLRQWRDSLLNQYILSAFNMTDERMNEYIDFIQHRRPTCLYGYASSLALLARFARDHGVARGGLGSHKLKAVFVTGEVLFDADREAIEEAFAAPASPGKTSCWNWWAITDTRSRPARSAKWSSRTSMPWPCP